MAAADLSKAHTVRIGQISILLEALVLAEVVTKNFCRLLSSLENFDVHHCHSVCDTICGVVGIIEMVTRICLD
jgi:hypothetical protein